MSYKPDRIERKNRRKAIFLTTLIYGSIMAFIVLKDDISWNDYLPEVVQEILGEEQAQPSVAETSEVRP